MKFENAFTVDAPVDEVWRTLLDVERVAPCMPGAEVTERIGDDAYKVSVKVKVGPMSMTYRGEVQIVDRDEQERRATMHVKAKEARGQGTADADVHMSLAEEAGKGGDHAGIIGCDRQGIAAGDAALHAAGGGNRELNDVGRREAGAFPRATGDHKAGGGCRGHGERMARDQARHIASRRAREAAGRKNFRG